MYTVKIGHPNSYLYCHRLIVFANSLYPDQTQQKSLHLIWIQTVFHCGHGIYLKEFMKQYMVKTIRRQQQQQQQKKFVSKQKELYLEIINLILALIINIISQPIELLNISSVFIV